MNYIKGTSGRDNIIGTEGRDYIIAGAGLDFYVLGGAGADVFEVNLGDEVIRIADFTLGEDVISLEAPEVLEQARFAHAGDGGDRFDIRLADNTLIRLNGVTEADIGALFVFRSEIAEASKVPVPEEKTPLLEPVESTEKPADPESGESEEISQSHFEGLNLIKGTSGRDNIIGTEGRDYIIAGAGQDFYVAGGAGADVFEVNLGDEVIRIADFTLGEDVISLETPEVLAQARFAQGGDGGDRFDIRLADNTLIRLNGVTEADIEDMFVFRSKATEAPELPETGENPAPVDPVKPEETQETVKQPEPEPPSYEKPAPEEPEAETAKVLKIVVFGGQSLNFGATGRDWVNTEGQFANSLMLDFSDPAKSARGWETENVDVSSFNGFTMRHEVDQETPATAAMNVLAKALPDVDFVSLHYGKAGQSLDFISEYTKPALIQQLLVLRDAALAKGYTIDPVIELAWTQGQSGASGDYSDMLSVHRDEVEVAVKSIFDADFSVNMYASIIRGFGGKQTTEEQFEAILSDPDIYLGATEVVFNSQFPAKGDPLNAHLSGEGYYMMGTQIGTHILANMQGDPVDPIAVERVIRIDETTLHIDFSGVEGELRDNPGVYSDDDFIGVPDHFGLGLYRTNGGLLSGEIISSRIVDDDTIEIVYSEELSGGYKLWVGRNESDGWIDGGGGAGYGGTTLYDDGQQYTAVDPAGGLELQMPSLYEYVPQQAFDFWV